MTIKFVRQKLTFEYTTYILEMALYNYYAIDMTPGSGTAVKSTYLIFTCLSFSEVTFATNRNGKPILICGGWAFRLQSHKDISLTERQRWRCSRYKYCNAVIHTVGDTIIKTNLNHDHTRSE